MPEADMPTEKDLDDLELSALGGDLGPWCRRIVPRLVEEVRHRRAPDCTAADPNTCEFCTR